MRGLSLKIKLTLIYTGFVLLAMCMALALLLSLSGREVLVSTRNQLEDRVQESVEEIESEDGILKPEHEFYSIENGVYLSVYDQDGYFLYGKIPYGFDVQPSFVDGEMRTIRDQNLKWYVYDISYRPEKGTDLYIRGIVSVSDAEEGIRITIRLALILFPALAVIEVLIGYRFTRKTLLPVKKITETVQEIQADADLSRRVELTEGQRQNRDEIYYLAQTFDNMLEELEGVFKREKRFTSDASHELRTPVSVILAQCEACLTDETLSVRQKNQIRLIEAKAREMTGLISSLLFFSRADEGRQSLNKERLNLSELTEMVAEEQQMLADAQTRRISIHTEITPDLYAMADESFYIRMLVNLISNAVYYSKEKGTVMIKLKREKEHAVGTVEDDGIGISKEDQVHIWERFYRADTSRTDSSHSGLGLPMVKWIAEAHGGKVFVESELHKGSKFTFFLPL